MLSCSFCAYLAGLKVGQSRPAMCWGCGCAISPGLMWLLSFCRAGGARSLLCLLQSMASLSEAAEVAGRHGRDGQSLGQVLADAPRTSRALMVQAWPGGSRGSVGGAQQAAACHHLVPFLLEQEHCWLGTESWAKCQHQRGWNRLC